MTSSSPRSAIVDFRDSTKNDWLAASQVWVAGDLHRRRTDMVLFVNGIPLVLVEFKEPNRPVKAAYDENLTDYRDTIPQLFSPNGFVILLERVGGQGRLDLRAVGVLRRLEGDRRRGRAAASSRWRPRSAALCAHDRLLDMVENFIAYIERPGGLIKVRGPNHQVLGVNAAIENLLPGPSGGREAARGVLAHPGLRQEPVDAVVHPEGAAPRSPATGRS